MFKKILVIMLCVSLSMLAFAGCGEKEQKKKDDGKKAQTSTSSGNSTDKTQKPEQGGDEMPIIPDYTDEELGIEPSLKVLAVGHSFGNNSVQYAHQIAKSLGQNLEITSLYYAGCTPAQHLKFYNDDWRCYKLYVNGELNSNSSLTFKEVLNEKQYDIITFQAGSCYMHQIEEFEPHYELTQKVRSHQPNAKFMMHETWSLAPGRRPPEFESLSTYGRYQYDLIAQNFATTAKNLGNLPVIRVGLAVQLTKEQGILSDDYGASTSIYADEISHLSEAGKYLAGCVWTQFLFKDKVDVRKTTYTINGLSATTANKLKAIAYDAVMNN